MASVEFEAALLPTDEEGGQPGESGEETGEAAPGCLSEYLGKFRGAGSPSAGGRPPLSQTACSFAGSFAGIAALGLINVLLLKLDDPQHVVVLVGSFGAMAVLLFSAYKAPLAQPKNVLVGNTVGGVIGVAAVEALRLAGLSDCFWLTGALAVSLTIAVQERLGAVHPPGGATALIYVTAKPVQSMGFIYAICPSLFGGMVMILVAMLSNNASEARTYPQGWGHLAVDESAQKAKAPEGAHPPAGYLRKFGGAGVAGPPVPPWRETLFSFLGSFAGIAALGLLDALVLTRLLPANGVPLLKLLCGPFGAMAVLVFSACKAPLAQPKNAVLGSTLGGIVGVAVFFALQQVGLAQKQWLSGALAVSLTIALQEQLGCVHPPGGATALTFAIMPVFQAMKAWYVLCPTLLGTLVTVALGVLANNASPARTYPQSWM